LAKGLIEVGDALAADDLSGAVVRAGATMMSAMLTLVMATMVFAGDDGLVEINSRGLGGQEIGQNEDQQGEAGEKKLLCGGLHRSSSFPLSIILAGVANVF
jgi:hypothetical protein